MDPNHTYDMEDASSCGACYREGALCEFHLREELARLREEFEAAKYALKWDLSEARALAERWRDAMGASPEGGNPLPWELEPSDPGQHVPHKRWLPEFE